MLHGVDEDAQQKIRVFWSKLAKEWRCAAVYDKKTQEFEDNKSFSTGSLNRAHSREKNGKFNQIHTSSN